MHDTQAYHNCRNWFGSVLEWSNKIVYACIYVLQYSVNVQTALCYNRSKPCLVFDEYLLHDIISMFVEMMLVF